MNRVELHFKDKIAIIGIVGLILSGLIFSTQKYAVENQVLMNRVSIDQSVSQLEATMKVESDMLLRVSQNLKTIHWESGANRISADMLRFVVNRKTYDYGLWIKPDQVINGSDYIAPRALEESGQKNVGDEIYWGDIFVDQEKSTLNIPIYVPLRASKNHEGMLYRVVDGSDLLRSLRKLSIDKGGRGFLINREKKIIQLETYDATYIDEMSGIIDQNLTQILNQSFDTYKNHYLISARPIKGSTWYFVYFQNERTEWVVFLSKIAILMATLSGLTYFIWLDHKKVTKAHEGAKALKASYEAKITELSYHINPWLSREAEQILVLREIENSRWLMDYKLNSALRSLSGELVERCEVTFSDILHWMNNYLHVQQRHMRIEVPSQMSKIVLNESLVSELVALVLVIGEMEAIQHIICRVDYEDFIISFAFLSDNLSIIDQIKVRMKPPLFHQDEKKAFERNFVGNKLFYHYGEVLEPVEVSPVYQGGELPKRIFLLLPSEDQNAVIQIYCERLGVEVSFVEQIEKVPENEILLLGIKTYSKIEEMASLGIKLPKRMILYGDEYEHELAGMAKNYGHIQRPYSIDRVEYALRFSDKQKEKYND